MDSQELPKSSMNYARFLTEISKARRGYAIRKYTDLLLRSPPTMISLGGGLPNPQLFPFKGIKVELRNGKELSIEGKALNSALQYGPTRGYTPLLEWLKEFQIRYHQPPIMDGRNDDSQGELMISTGSQDALSKSLEMLLSPGDNILMESPTYPAPIEMIRPHKVNILPVETDNNGLIPESLEKILSRWKPEDAANPSCTIPKVLYTCPNGGNPTGSSLTVERKEKIYELAQKYNFLILEDDPYYFLQFGEKTRSFLNMDTDGRVIRFDSFSKVLSAGMRLGFATGPKALIDRLVLHSMVSIMHPGNVPQVMAHELLKEWGYDGFSEHTDEVKEFYKKKRDDIIRSANKWLKGLAEWEVPTGGMFLWIKLLGIPDTKALIETKAIEKEVLFIPGSAFHVDEDVPSSYIRASFSTATPEQIDTALERLSGLIKDERQ